MISLKEKTLETSNLVDFLSKSYALRSQSINESITHVIKL